MNEIEQINADIKNCKEAYNNIITAMYSLNEIDDLDEEYKMLDDILEKIDNKRVELEIEEEKLKEEAFYKENEQQWKAEQRKQEYDYENSRF